MRGSLSVHPRSVAWSFLAGRAKRGTWCPWDALTQPNSSRPREERGLPGSLRKRTLWSVLTTPSTVRRLWLPTEGSMMGTRGEAS